MDQWLCVQEIGYVSPVLRIVAPVAMYPLRRAERISIKPCAAANTTNLCAAITERNAQEICHARLNPDRALILRPFNDFDHVVVLSRRVRARLRLTSTALSHDFRDLDRETPASSRCCVTAIVHAVIAVQNHFEIF
jgi:hypothetical protein